MYIQKISKYYFEKIGQPHIFKKIISICAANIKHIQLQLDVLFKDEALRRYTMQEIENIKKSKKGDSKTVESKEPIFITEEQLGQIKGQKGVIYFQIQYMVNNKMFKDIELSKDEVIDDETMDKRSFEEQNIIMALIAELLVDYKYFSGETCAYIIENLIYKLQSKLVEKQDKIDSPFVSVILSSFRTMIILMLVKEILENQKAHVTEDIYSLCLTDDYSKTINNIFDFINNNCLGLSA